MSMVNRAMDGREWLLLAALSLVWGGTFFFIEVALVDLPPLTIVLGRVGIAAAALVALTLALGLRLPREPGMWSALLVMGALNNVLPFTLIATAQTEITSGLAAILNSTAPLFSLLLAHLLGAGERITAHRLGGLLLGVAGVAVLVGPDAIAGLGGRGLAQIAVLAAALAYACAALYGRRFKGTPPLVVACGQLICSTLLALPAALVVDRPWQLVPGASTWAALVSLALLGTALAYLIYFRLLASAGATNLLLVALLAPASALVLGVLFLGEPVAPAMLAGMALIAAGLVTIDGRALGLPRRPRPLTPRAP
jgi:drug/metabolite transporter (DMT)-like permease